MAETAPGYPVNKKELEEKLGKIFNAAAAKRQFISFSFSFHFHPGFKEWRYSFYTEAAGGARHRHSESKLDTALDTLLKETADQKSIPGLSYDIPTLTKIFAALMEMPACFYLAADFRKHNGNVFLASVYGETIHSPLSKGKKIGNCAEDALHEAAFLAGAVIEI
jgi:hypothetical protein